MSGIAGLLSFADGPIDHALVRRMLETIAYRGSDDVGVTTDGAVAMGYRIQWTTEDARRERQPLRSTDGRLMLVYDGRLDNRDEVAARLRLPPSTTDGALIVGALARDGADALPHLLGDFALACWHSGERRLWLVRDSLGIRPLYYAVTPAGVIWASDLQAVLVPGWLARRPNEGAIAEHLALTPSTLDETPFDGVCRVPQAHLLEVVAPRVTRRRYWTPHCREERVISDADAVEEYRSHLTAAVRACVRATGPVAFQLSGGLDSSTIVGIAHRDGLRRPATFSLVYPVGAEAHESPFVDSVVRFVDAEARRFDPPAFDAGVFDHALRHDDLPGLPTGEPLLAGLLKGAAASGHRVMLTGAGADQWLMFSLFRIASLLRRGRPIACARYVADVRRFLMPYWRWRWVIEKGLLPLVPDAAKARVRPFLRRDSPVPWIDARFARRVGLADRLRASYLRVPAVADPVVRESLVRLTSGEEAAVREEWERMGSHAGLEFRHPYYDRRVVEFLLALPDDLRFRGGLAKYLTRRAFADVLPDDVRRRHDKSSLDDVLLAIARAAGRAADWRTLRTADLGWVDGARIRAQWQAIERSGTAGPDWVLSSYAVWHVLAVEAWLRHAFA